MPYELVLTEDALGDIDETLEYIIGALSNKPAARNLMDRLEDCFERIREHPYSYEQCGDARLKALGYHKAVIENYILIYRPDDTERSVYILRFFYGGRDYEKLL